MLVNKQQIGDIEWHANYAQGPGHRGIERDIKVLRTILLQMLDELTETQRDSILAKIGVEDKLESQDE